MTRIVETILGGGSEAGLVGILCEPDQRLHLKTSIGIIFLNAGNTHRVGPNRLYVMLSRTLARHGFTCCRFDLSGLGDSPARRDGSRLRDYALLETRQVMRKLEQCYGLRMFILVGLCGGADIAFDVACSSDHVIGSILINGAFVDGGAFAQAYHKAERDAVRRFYRQRMLSWRGWVRVLTMRSGLWKRFAKKFYGRVKENFPVTSEPMAEQTRQKWATLARRNAEIMMLFSEGSLFWDMFQNQTGKTILEIFPPDKLHLVLQRATDHTFTLLSSQNILEKKILSWLREKLPCGVEFR